jgi:GTP-dependent phosphoenolpyruvate carboxykinase
MTSNQILKRWVEEVSELTGPDNIHWCTGSQQENQQLVDGMLASGVLIELNQETHPGCYLRRSDPDDVARVEHLTFICTPERLRLLPTLIRAILPLASNPGYFKVRRVGSYTPLTYIRH